MILMIDNYDSFTYNIVQGIVNGIKFHDITMGSSNGSDYYLWMHRL